MKTIFLIITQILLSFAYQIHAQCSCNFKIDASTKYQEKPCQFTKDNFNLIKNKVKIAKIEMGDWVVSYVESDNSISYQHFAEEIFVVFLKGNDAEFIGLGKIGFTVSEEEQKVLFCKTVQLIKNRGSSHG